MGCSPSAPNKKIQEPKPIESLARDQKTKQTLSTLPAEGIQDTSSVNVSSTPQPIFSKKFLVPNHAVKDVNSDTSIIESSTRKAQSKSPKSKRTNESPKNESFERTPRLLSRSGSPPSRSKLSPSLEKVPESMRNFPVKVSSINLSQKDSPKKSTDDKETRKLVLYSALIPLPNILSNSTM